MSVPTIDRRSPWGRAYVSLLTMARFGWPPHRTLDAALGLLLRLVEARVEGPAGVEADTSGSVIIVWKKGDAVRCHLEATRDGRLVCEVGDDPELVERVAALAGLRPAA